MLDGILRQRAAFAKDMVVTRISVLVVCLSACSGSEVNASPPHPQPSSLLACPDASEPIVVECDKSQTSHAAAAKTSLGDDALTLKQVPFSALPDWNKDQHAEAVKAFLRSCAKEMPRADNEPMGAGAHAGTIAQWRGPCAAATSLKPGDDRAAKAFFETHFTACETGSAGGKNGKFTGYYVQPLRVSRKRTPRFAFPLLKRPSDLVEVQLSDFIADGRSRRIWGQRAKDGTLHPYPTRATIYKNLSDSDVLAWTDDPVDAIAIQIEGSGVGRLPNGEDIWIHFDGKNGRRGGRNGAVLRAMRKLRGSNGQRVWSKNDLQKFAVIADSKVSEVFFKFEPRKGAIGTQDVVLTPQRSVAVDRAVIPLSAPLWIDTKAPPPNGGKQRPYRRLVIAQDTGGNILGSVRVDIYTGFDAAARRIGGRIHHPGRVWILLPKAIKVDASKNKPSSTE